MTDSPNVTPAMQAWLEQVQRILEIRSRISEGNAYDRAVDLFLNNFSPEDAAEELWRPVSYLRLVQDRAAGTLLGALKDLTVYASAGPEGCNGDIWISQAKAAIAQAEAAGIVP